MKELSKYRLSDAYDKLTVSKELLDNDHLKDSINRSYYSMFASMRALLAEDGVDFKHHSAVISYFRKEFIKSGKLDEKYSDYVGNAFHVRNACDYNDFYVVDRGTAAEQADNAEELYDAVKNFIEKISNENK
ncbi:MAG: HEPN domain-containing protein [Lachnospiraceae bacterium]|nr:HEPN domain-containing protein [Lachnospiraceae bacterium]